MSGINSLSGIVGSSGTSLQARAPTGRAYFERVSVTERRRIEPFPLPAAARLRVTFRTRERECGGMATPDVEGADEDDGTGDLHPSLITIILVVKQHCDLHRHFGP